ncbi:MAG: hypothetical protein ABIT37_23660 [Luteolibacter sp.]
MKNLNLIVATCIGLSSLCLASVDSTPTMSICRNLEQIVWNEFLAQGKKLPVNWDDIQAIQEMKQNHASYAVREFKLYNSLAIVPGAPIIAQQPGISQNHANRKLFAISRTSNFDYATKDQIQKATDAGRFAILVSSDDSEIAPSWIPEPEIQHILKQLNGFEPTKQPVAFDQVEEYEREQKEKKELFNKELNEVYHNKIQSEKARGTADSKNLREFPGIFRWGLWCAVSILTLMLAGLILRRISKGSG